MKKLEKICKEYQELSPLWIYIADKEWSICQEKITEKSLRKIIQQLLFLAPSCAKKEEKYIFSTSQNVTQIMKNKPFF